ncbi:hypothetical protein ACP4OV_013175 [Aristida adscensionis]
MDGLPDDVLAAVLGRLPPSSLAASRCVRRHWCAVIDGRRLLRADLLPLRLAAFLCCADQLDSLTYFFSPPSVARRIPGGARLDDLVVDHCNGLLLLWECVANPATGQSARLPPFPEPCLRGFHQRYFIAYDPFFSPDHFQVLCFLTVPSSMSDDIAEESEWPPETYTTRVFSSRTWRWEERSFVRQEGEAAGTVADMRQTWQARRNHAVYLRGALYVHCQNDSVMRIGRLGRHPSNPSYHATINLSSDKYQMIKPPAARRNFHDGVLHLGKSEKGVYFALLYWDENEWPLCLVWLLDESCDEMDWVFKSNINLHPVVENFPFDHDKHSKPWVIINYYKHDVMKEAPTEDEFEWDFDDGIILPETEDMEAGEESFEIVFLGFHPYEEIAFFLLPSDTVVSYHLNTLKVQELGILREQQITNSFPYTPCRMVELFGNS